jgi:hypothetical protein
MEGAGWPIVLVPLTAGLAAGLRSGWSRLTRLLLRRTREPSLDGAVLHDADRDPLAAAVLAGLIRWAADRPAARRAGMAAGGRVRKGVP